MRSCGYSVEVLSAVGKGCPDIIVGAHGMNYFLEIKDGAKPPSARKLTPEQIKWHSAWAGQIDVVCSLDEAIAVVTDHH